MLGRYLTENHNMPFPGNTLVNAIKRTLIEQYFLPIGAIHINVVLNCEK
jgi:hypothetical protein